MPNRFAQDRERCGLSCRNTDDWNLLLVGVNIIVNALNMHWCGVSVGESPQLVLVGDESILAK